jgi:RNA polymerase sigma factor (sigma-70 family)
MSPDEMVTQSQLDARLGLAIGKLSERLRLVVTMLYEEGVSQRESANRLGITEGRFSQLRG